ncbi:flagellar hook assembly protein FlgD [Methylobacterium sp. ID0610]|uniref:flagellar hook assembly protein FlgD n=1 Tax=Methylobacterium carpenticola TaxID=3344827 RepID=UPI0036D17CF5
MDVTGTSSAASATSQTSANSTSAKTTSSTAASLNSDNFLSLLLTQLKNQDPTKPMDSTDYMGELATFSEVEQSTKTNQKLDAILASNYLSQADQAIGRTVTSSDGSVSGTVSAVKITSDGPVATLKDGRELLLGNGVTLS